jgi:hypothetical protein
MSGTSEPTKVPYLREQRVATYQPFKYGENTIVLEKRGSRVCLMLWPHVAQNLDDHGLLRRHTELPPLALAHLSRRSLHHCGRCGHRHDGRDERDRRHGDCCWFGSNNDGSPCGRIILLLLLLLLRAGLIIRLGLVVASRLGLGVKF